jgi:hypothetical protein
MRLLLDAAQPDTALGFFHAHMTILSKRDVAARYRRKSRKLLRTISQIRLLRPASAKRRWG